MTDVRQVYKCEVCGNMIEVVHRGGGTLSCCGRAMELLAENAMDASTEKHIPLVEKLEDGLVVKIGKAEHPMADDHYIEWVEIHSANKVCRKWFKPGEKPEAIFKLDEDIIFARGYCNQHGLWKK